VQRMFDESGAFIFGRHKYERSRADARGLLLCSVARQDAA
jgi:hypothetical protein